MYSSLRVEMIGDNGLERTLEGSQVMREVRRGDQQSGPRISCNVLDLPDMQPGIDRNRAKTRSPAGEQQFEKFRAVLHAQHDAVAGFEPACGETAGEARDAAGEFAIIPGVNAVADRRRLGLPASDIEQQRCEVHGDPAWQPFGINSASS